ncbi:alanine- and arginine-rich domain-containing protein [Halichoerus grypus]
MGPEDSDRRREATAPGPHGVPVSVGLWTPAPGPAHGSPGGSKSVDGQEEAHAASQLLEDLRRRLARASRRTGRLGNSRRPRALAGPDAEAAARREEQSRARVENALAGLRAGLLEMRFQNHRLARTLLDLNMKMQQLKKEHELDIASESQSSEDNIVNLE